MWRLWPSLRRLWAAIGAIIIGLIVMGLYSFLSKQLLPDLQIATHTLTDRWPWFGGGLVVLAIVSAVAEHTYRRYEWCRDYQPCAVAARYRASRRSSHDARRDLRLVH